MSEDVFLKALFSRLGEFPREVVVPPGDDCAAIVLNDEQALLVAVDQVVGDRHYVRYGGNATPPHLVGRKLLARNLSDIAAMGGEPTFALVASATTSPQDHHWLNAFFDGIIDLGRQFNVVVIGGDLSSAPLDSVASLTILGTVPLGQICRRSGACPGDLLYATGTFGGSLQSGWHLKFIPRCKEARWLASRGIPRAMIDVSDGLLADLGRMCSASNVTAFLNESAIPGRNSDLPIENRLSDGEDYELLFAVSADAVAHLVDWPFKDVLLSCIGVISEPGIAPVLNHSGQPFSLSRNGYDHFASS